jgi:hypothetical protein
MTNDAIFAALLAAAVKYQRQFSGLNYAAIGDLVGRKITGRILPKDLAGTWTDTVDLGGGNSYTLTIEIKASPETKRKSSAHRVFVRCSCGKSIPLGRIVQHGKAVKHGGSGHGNRTAQRGDNGRFRSRWAQPSIAELGKLF